VFVVVVGDGVRTFGDVDQSTADGLTGDEANPEAALGLLGDKGGSIFIRSGNYQLEHPVLVRGILVGTHPGRRRCDGDLTSAAAAARSTSTAAAPPARLSFEEPVPDRGSQRGDRTSVRPSRTFDLPSFKVRSLFDKLIESRFSRRSRCPPSARSSSTTSHVEGGVPELPVRRSASGCSCSSPARAGSPARWSRR